MPAVSLVVCLYKERELLERLLEKASGCYDDLVVVHDGAEDKPINDSKDPEKQVAIDFDTRRSDDPFPPEYRKPALPPLTGGIHELVKQHGGCYYEGPRAFQQEPHWSFAWWQAKHDWILRLDADEFPSEGMKIWLKKFWQSAEPPQEISGYTCIWPLWDGKRTVSRKLPANRIFLFHKQRVRFFGMVEQVPVADHRFDPIDLVLHHQPLRKSYGLQNLLVRKQAYRWRAVIARSLLGKPTDLPRWRWKNESWPEQWEQIRRGPLRTACSRFFLGTLRTLRDQWRNEQKFYPSAAISGPIHHTLICLEHWQLLRRKKARK